jgi:hypothetical protein
MHKDSLLSRPIPAARMRGMYDRLVSAAFIFGALIISIGAASQYRYLIWTGLAIQALGWVRLFAIKRRPPPRLTGTGSAPRAAIRPDTL